MATTLILNNEPEDVEIPLVRSLEEFRQWARSDAFPERGRIDYVVGHIEVDMSPEDVYTHGALKTSLIVFLGRLMEEKQLGEVFSDRMRVSNPVADLSAEPDVVFISRESYRTGRVRRVPKGGQPRRYVELEGSPDLIVEILSDSSETKDMRRLPSQYWQAGIAEFWLADARGEEMFFRVHCRGPSGWEPVEVASDGFQYSAVLDTRLRVVRRPGEDDSWVFAVERKDPSNR